ncbi:MAG TPA: GPW/gp25 family protein [Blastocatellia bacterium]|nr:GPW/gp25 family protein [Blastocatellia bacterium]
MAKTFLGVGWSFPVEVDSNGALITAKYEESVRQSIWIILSTAKGERAMRPDFGCGIYDMVFEVNSPSTAGNVVEEIRQSLLFLEPRVDVLDIQAVPEGSGEALLISIDYQVRATNNIFNLVYPFYLERSGV